MTGGLIYQYPTLVLINPDRKLLLSTKLEQGYLLDMETIRVVLGLRERVPRNSKAVSWNIIKGLYSGWLFPLHQITSKSKKKKNDPG